ncbi:MAG: metallophosphoesterase [Balneolales bacterium]|nr:metallophosphoesterase [Balneolales bacterium]
MSNLLLFSIFYLMMITVFGSMQYVVYKAYTKWYNYSFPSETMRSRCRKIAYAVLVIGNLLFYPRFIISYTDLHNSYFIQQTVIYPGGLYFAFISILFGGSVLFYLYRFISGYFGPTSKAANSVSSSAPTATDDTTRSQLITSEPTNTADATTANINPDSLSRRKFIKMAGTAAFTAPLLLTTGLSVKTHRDYIISKNTFYFPDLPSGLEGLKITHISDIHSGIFMTKGQIQDIFKIVNSTHPNLIAITGDLVDTHVSEIPNIRDSVSMLKSDYGVFGCPGNHDHYASINGLMDALKGGNLRMLQNDAFNLSINGEAFSILGIDDAGETGRDFSDLNLALGKANPDAFRLLLSHRPHLFDEARPNNIHLTLAGHTHGGQIGFEFAGAEFYPIDWFHPYSRGHYMKDHKHLYVNVGVGLVGAPIRLVRPEITEITLTSNPSKAMQKITSA